MNRLEQRPRISWSDDDLDRLLSDFFRNEMPDELRSPDFSPADRPPPDRPPADWATMAPPPVAKESAAGVRPAYRGGAVGISAVALTLLLALALLWSPSASQNSLPSAGRETLSTETRGTDAEHPAVIVAPAFPGTAQEPALSEGADGPSKSWPAAGMEYFVRERVEPVERFTYDTTEGPVEQRAERRVTNVSVYDPESGARLEVELPELTIEIFPIEDEK